MRRSRLIIFGCFGLLMLILASCIEREPVEQSPQVSESVQFQPTEEQEQGQTPVQQPAGLVQTGHVLYMTAEDSMFRPDEAVTRGQMAQILCGLLENGNGYTPGTEPAFTDVGTDRPEYASVEQLASAGVLSGYGDGTFRPDEPVTRSEMVTSLCRLMGVDQVTALAFPDVGAEHWAMGSVAAAMASGWLSGYQDGGFYPDAPLTRAEAAVLLNRARGESPNKTAIDLACPASPYQDVPQDFWAYYDVVDVSYRNELLSYILGEAEDVTQGMILLDERLGHINAELKLDYFQKGFHTIQDGLATDGIYYAPEDGYFLQRSHPGLQELDGSMFYVEREDGPFVAGYDLGYLHFGDNGRYTSGDQEVDGYVDTIMAGIIQGDTASLLNEEKLREAYDVLLFGNYDYMTRPTGWQRGTTSWSLDCARTMYQTRRGSCYYWAASFLYLARRLGFQAYPVCGGVNENNALHAWVMIDHGSQIDDNDVNTEQNQNELTRVIDEDEYIYDIELDWAYRTGAHGRVPIRPGRDLFKQTRGHTIVHYIFPGDTWYAPPMDETDAIGDEQNADNEGELFENSNGDELTEGVDYTTSYVNNGDGTITVTITYLTGDQAGTTTSYTVLDPNYDPNAAAPTADPNAGVTTDPNGGTTTDPNAGVTTDPNAGVTTDPNAGTTTDPNAGTTTDPNAGITTDPNAGTTTDPNEGVTTDPNAGVTTDPNAGTTTDPNAGITADPNAGVTTDPNGGITTDPNGGDQTGGDQTGGDQTGVDQSGGGDQTVSGDQPSADTGGDQAADAPTVE